MLRRGIKSFLTSHAVVLELLGSRQDRQYLVMFQNNRELRPTGGFIGSFALVDVSRGEVRKVLVDTIYNPDGQLKDFLIPPVPLQKITDRWFARDANWFADFRTSASKVAHLFERSGGPTVDGVLAITPVLLEDLLRLTGPISMSLRYHGNGGERDGGDAALGNVRIRSGAERTEGIYRGFGTRGPVAHHHHAEGALGRVDGNLRGSTYQETFSRIRP
jgi:hypothetical protein